MNNECMNFSTLFIIVDFFSNHLLELVQEESLYSYVSQAGVDPGHVQEIIRHGLITVDNKKNCTVNYASKIVKDIKRARDTYLVEQLPNGIAHEIYFLADQIMMHTDKHVLSVLLIGSAARRSMHSQSDIDMLVVAENKFKFRTSSAIRKTQVEVFGREEFLASFDRRDELTLWAIKHGLIIHDNNFIFDFYQYTNVNIGKHSVLRKRKLIYNLTEDIRISKDISTERLRAKIGSLIYQIARYILILNGEIPLAKRELAEQVRRYSPDLSELIVGYETDLSMDAESLTKLFFRVRRTFSSAVGSMEQPYLSRPLASQRESGC
ncbi:MAG: nucleotidyltransferase domain-containing protein [Syntrophobacteraceae bacterium]